MSLCHPAFLCMPPHPIRRPPSLRVSAFTDDDVEDDLEGESEEDPPESDPEIKINLDLTFKK